MNNYRGILQELLSQKIYILNKKELAFVEIFLIVAKKNKDISESIKSFRAWESKPFTFYLRITIIRNNIETFNDKINVYELLDLYILKKYPENRQEFMKMKHEFNQGIFKAISVFLLEELQVLLQTFGVEILRTKHFLEKIDGKKNSVEAPIQIYRTVLSIRPLQIVTIFYDKIKELFVFTVYNNKKSKMVESKITLRKAERLIPYIRHFLTLGLNDKLGVRILKDLNIKLLMNAYVKFN